MLWSLNARFAARFRIRLISAGSEPAMIAIKGIFQVVFPAAKDETITLSESGLDLSPVSPLCISIA
jgi:hypothetical protein